jgi:hypothetical protein
VASLAETGDMVGGLLREGNAGPAENADTWIPHLVRRLNESTCAQVRVRIDAGFTDNATLEALEDRDIEYLGRLRSHIGLQKLAAPHLKRPPGRQPEQPREWCHDLEYQAGSWPTPRRVVLVVLVLVVQERPDDLLVHAFFLVTNLGKFDWPSEKILALSASEAAPRRTWARSSRRSPHTSHRLIAAPPLSRTRWPATR